jgi:hypothetical protein
MIVQHAKFAPVRIGAGIVLACMLALGAGAQTIPEPEQPPQPPPPAARQSERPHPPTHEAPAADQRGSEQVPLVVKTLPQPKAPAEEAKERYEGHEKPNIERSMLALTLGLLLVALIQVVMFVRQLKLMRKATEDAGIAARAAHIPLARYATVSPKCSKPRSCSSAPT